MIGDKMSGMMARFLRTMEGILSSPTGFLFLLLRCSD